MRTLIVLVCILALAATIGTIVVGLKSFEGIVVEKPYEAGLAWDQTRQNKEKLGWTVTLQNPLFKTGYNELSLLIMDRHQARLADAVAFVTVSRPSTRAYDKKYSLVRQPDMSYRAAIDLPLMGNWDIISEIDYRGDHAGFNNVVYAEQETGMNCDIQKGACIRETGDGTRISLEILPRPVTAMSELTFIITLSKNGKPVTDAAVQLDLTMPAMYMGKNRLSLKHVKNGIYEGHGMITRCMSGSKTWSAKVFAGSADKNVAADFIFEAR